MTTRGTFIWNELVTAEPERCGPFYFEVFGWERSQVDAGPLGIYTTFKLDGNSVAGMRRSTGAAGKQAPPSLWTGYVAVDDIDAVVGTVQRAGGTLHVSPFDVPGEGRIAMLSDPCGGRISLMQPSTPG